jgi:hypothetical protein
MWAITTNKLDLFGTKWSTLQAHKTEHTYKELSKNQWTDTNQIEQIRP